MCHNKKHAKFSKLLLRRLDVGINKIKFVIYVKDNEQKEFSSFDTMKEFITTELKSENISESNIFFSYSKEKI